MILHEINSIVLPFCALNKRIFIIQLGMGSSCSILPIRHRENEKSWRSWSGHGRPASIAETGCLPRSRSEILPCEIASQVSY